MSSAEPAAHHQYMLTSIISHVNGVVRSTDIGHFVCDSRESREGPWMLCNDGVVTPSQTVHPISVKREQGYETNRYTSSSVYMLIYQALPALDADGDHIMRPAAVEVFFFFFFFFFNDFFFE